MRLSFVVAHRLPNTIYSQKQSSVHGINLMVNGFMSSAELLTLIERQIFTYFIHNKAIHVNGALRQMNHFIHAI